MANVEVFVKEPWLAPWGGTYLPGMRLWLSATIYAKYRPLGYFGRELIRARHFSGVEYWHAAGCGGHLLMPTEPRPTVLEPEGVPVPPSYTPKDDNPAVLVALGPPPPKVVRAGCGGCGKRRKEARS